MLMKKPLQLLLLSFVIASCAYAQTNMFRQTPEHNAVITSASDYNFADEAWVFNAGAPIRSTTVFNDNTVFFGNSKGILYALNKSTGAIQWQYNTGYAINSSPAISNNNIFFSDNKQTLYSLNASTGKLNDDLLRLLNDLPYYDLPHPKSLPNSFGTEEVYPLIKKFDLPLADALRTYVEHITIQVKNALIKTRSFEGSSENINNNPQLLITGGGALNGFMIGRLKDHLRTTGVNVIVPAPEIINYKEALIIALIGTLRWREEYNVIASVTGARRNSIGGALWLGTEA